MGTTISLYLDRRRIDALVNNEWYFWTTHGKSFMGINVNVVDNILLPPLPLTGERNARFLIEQVSDNIVTIAYIAPGTEVRRYISCRKTGVAGHAPAELRRRVTDLEMFVVSYNRRDDSFLFRSHNELYLHYNEITKYVNFSPLIDKDPNDVPTRVRWNLLKDVEANRTGRLNADRRAAAANSKVAGAAARAALSASAVALKMASGGGCLN
jgi:hypothetical protein